MAGQIVGALTDAKEKVIAVALSGKALIIAGALGLLGEEAVTSYAAGKLPKGTSIPDEVIRELMQLVGGLEQTVGEPIFDALIGSTVSKADFSAGSQAGEAASLVKKFLGFGAGLPLVAGQIQSGLRLALGEHAPEGLLEAIKELPGDLGVNFFIGTVIERIFEEAVSEPLGEAIREAYRPVRLEGQQIIRLLKTKDLPHDKAVQLLRRAGYRDEDIPLFEAFDRTLLPTGDIQQAYLHGLIDEQGVFDKLHALGLNEEDAKLAQQLYIAHAETEGGNVYRQVARIAYVDDLITEGHLREILAMVNVPGKSIDLEVEALNLEKLVGKTHLNVATIKQLYLHGDLNQDSARQKLINLGFAADEAADFFKLWDESSGKGKQGISESRILAYLVSGVLTEQEAYDRLVAMGVRPADAQLLVQHPSARPGKLNHGLSPSTIVSAFKDGTMTADEAIAKLVENGRTQAEAQLEISNASVALSHRRKPKGAAKTLTQGEVVAAFEHGLASMGWALHELVNMGYGDGDAQLVLAEAYVRSNKELPPDWVVLT